MSENTTKAGISKMDLKALREADRVCFFHQEGKGLIRAVKTVKDKGPYDDRERTYEISTESRVRVYKSDLGSREMQDAARCFAMVYSWQPSEWATIASLLKEGDVLILEWVGTDNNGYLDRQGEKLHHDRLRLLVKREGKRDMLFHVDDSICADNTARMVRIR